MSTDQKSLAHSHTVSAGLSWTWGEGLSIQLLHCCALFFVCSMFRFALRKQWEKIIFTTVMLFFSVFYSQMCDLVASKMTWIVRLCMKVCMNVVMRSSISLSYCSLYHSSVRLSSQTASITSDCSSLKNTFARIPLWSSCFVSISSLYNPPCAFTFWMFPTLRTVSSVDLG